MFERRSRLLYMPPRYSGAAPFDTRPRRDPIRIGRCSIPTGHWFSHAPHVVHCQRTFSEYRSTSFVSLGLVSSPACVCRMIAFGFSSLPAPHAGQFTWQRPHSTQVNASSTLLLPRSFTVSSPTCSFSKSRFGTFPSSGDFRKTVIGDSSRCRCFDAGMSARNARITTTWSHQFTTPAGEPSSSRHVRRKVIMSVAMNSPITIDSADTCVPSATGRTNARRTSR